jgi:hypothetical protein
VCGQKFSAPQSMKQHRLLHTGEKPWKCKHCGKAFPQQSACSKYFEALFQEQITNLYSYTRANTYEREASGMLNLWQEIFRVFKFV